MLARSSELLLPPPLPSPTLAEGLVVLHVVLLPGLASHSLLLQTTHCRLPMKTRLQRGGRERERDVTVTARSTYTYEYTLPE